MDVIRLFKCLSDMQRLRILHLLGEGPLCVCHIQQILEETQVRTSKSLAYLKRMGMVTVKRQGTWMIYALAAPSTPILLENLKCLRASQREYPVFEEDLKRRKTILSLIKNSPACSLSPLPNPKKPQQSAKRQCC